MIFKALDIKSLKIGKKATCFFICINKEVKQTKNGDLFIDVLLKNRFGTINGKIWDNVTHFRSKFNNGDPVAVKAECSEFNGEKLLFIRNALIIGVLKFLQYSGDSSP